MAGWQEYRTNIIIKENVLWTNIPSIFAKKFATKTKKVNQPVGWTQLKSKSLGQPPRQQENSLQKTVGKEVRGKTPKGRGITTGPTANYCENICQTFII